MNEKTSKKQQELLEFIDDFIKQHGYAPSFREIMSGLGYKSVSTVAVHVNGLLAKGYIRKRDNSARSIEVVTLGKESAASVAAGEDHKAWLRSEVGKLKQGDISEADTKVLDRAAQLLGVELA